MEVSILSENGLRIKSKLAVLGVDPISGKGPIDGAILLDRLLSKDKIITDGNPVIISGPGEYEIKGIKLNAWGKDDVVVYSGKIDNISICITKASSLQKAKDILEECEVVIIDADSIPEQKMIAILNPRVVILYGLHSTESAKSFGKEVTPITKYSVTRDKLPQEMEIIVLDKS